MQKTKYVELTKGVQYIVLHVCSTWFPPLHGLKVTIKFSASCFDGIPPMQHACFILDHVHLLTVSEGWLALVMGSRLTSFHASMINSSSDDYHFPRHLLTGGGAGFSINHVDVRHLFILQKIVLGVAMATTIDHVFQDFVPHGLCTQMQVAQLAPMAYAQSKRHTQ
jgi:hypothetical protein